ncbi:discoidin domain-containing protein [Halosquirtibacter laminarini]|uniref:Discoidin domain-containing protein n=1 Tax=Halosquirtibacter laminarini TaxID=3374600 RepID=A0AC61NCT2_9BACT|nr:discoidin domain-containing protein [Prolixibacteraceae bacterium]
MKKQLLLTITLLCAISLHTYAQSHSWHYINYIFNIHPNEEMTIPIGYPREIDNAEIPNYKYTFEFIAGTKLKQVGDVKPATSLDYYGTAKATFTTTETFTYEPVIIHVTYKNMSWDHTIYFISTEEDYVPLNYCMYPLREENKRLRDIFDAYSNLNTYYSQPWEYATKSEPSFTLDFKQQVSISNVLIIDQSIKTDDLSKNTSKITIQTSVDGNIWTNHSFVDASELKKLDINEDKVRYLKCRIDETGNLDGKKFYNIIVNGNNKYPNIAPKISSIPASLRNNKIKRSSFKISNDKGPNTTYTIDLGESYDISRLIVFNDNHNKIQNKFFGVKWEIKDDNSQWVTVWDDPTEKRGVQDVSFEKDIHTRYLRYTTNVSIHYDFSLEEIKIFGQSVSTPNIELGMNKKELTIYPSPAENQIYINNTQDKDINYEVYNILGNKVMQINNHHNSNPVDISSLGEGCYILRSSTTKKSCTFIKK